MNEKPDIHAAELRRQAEEAVARMARTKLPASEDEKTMHELLVHQIELEMQNEELRRLQTSLEEERMRLRSILDTMFDPHVMLEPVRDENGKITDFVLAGANETACRYSNLDRAHLVGTRLLELLPSHDSHGLLEMCRQSLESDHPLVLNDFVYPHEIHAEERRYDIRAVRVGHALSITWRDVTDRYLLAQKLAASEEHYRLLTQNTYDTAMRIADDHRVLWVSPSLTALLGWDTAEWIGRSLADFLGPGSMTTLENDLRRLATGEPVISRYEVRAKDGSTHWAESRAKPYLDAQGRVKVWSPLST